MKYRIFDHKKSIDEDGNPISVWNPDEPEIDSDSKGRVSQVELFYSNGDICDITGEPREVIVRLKVGFLLYSRPLTRGSLTEPNVT